MASKWPPVKNSAFTFRCVLFAQSDNQIKANPTTAAGDWKVSTDGAAFANLATLPDVDPDSSVQVLVSLSAGEMNGDEIMVTAIDAAGAEWHSAAWVIHTAGQTLDTIEGLVDELESRLTATRAAYLDNLASMNDLSRADVRDALGLASANLDTQLADLPTVAEFEARTIAAADYYDPANDLVKLHGTQGAVTFGQVKVAASVANEGALHITNAHGDGHGLHAEGGYYGNANIGSVAGQYNEGDAVGGAGQRNEATSGNGHGQYNYATAAGGTGQTNYGFGGHVSPAWAQPGADGDTLETLSDQLDAVGTTVDSILADTGTDGVVVAPRTVEGTIDEIEALRLVLAALVGKATGGGTATVTFRDTGDTTDRIILTVDSSGNRSAVTLDAS